MKQIDVAKRNYPVDKANKQYAREDDVDEIIKPPFHLTADGRRIASAVIMDSPTLDVVEKTIRKVEYHTATRLSGFDSTSRIFGYKPRDPVRNPFCSATKLAEKEPSTFRAVCGLATDIERDYKKLFPAQYKDHTEKVSEVSKEYRMGETVFTSGIINKDNQLPYHYDVGNFNDVVSCMVSFTSGVDGGNLLMPEYNVGIETTNRSLIIFNGQGVLHGVSPFDISSKGYRYTLVYYSLKKMWECLTPDEELKRVRAYRREQLLKRANDPDYKKTNEGRDRLGRNRVMMRSRKRKKKN
jgi:hypothetical protein